MKYVKAKEAMEILGLGEIEYIELWGVKLAEKRSVIKAARRIVPTKPRSGTPQDITEGASASG